MERETERGGASGRVYRPHTEEHRPSVQRRPFRAATLCLGVLCFLMLTGIIILSIHHTSVTFELKGTISGMEVNNSQLQSSYEALGKNHSQLQDEVKQLKNKTEGMEVNNSQLQSSYEALSKNHRQLQDEVKQLKDKIEGKWCPDRWTRFGCSCYFKSNEWKTWSDSRSDCQNKGADLVIINNKEEQKFVTELNSYGDSWIGLLGTNGKWIGSRWEWEWKWVDSSPMTKTFWASGMPYSSWNQYAAAFCDKQGKWKVGSPYDSKIWICEK